MKTAIFPLLLITFLFIGVSSVSAADIVINEFSPQSSPEWVELYNTTGDEINIINWKIKDKANPANELADVCIPPLGFYTYETTSWLNNSDGDSISILDQDDNVVDSLSYGNSGDTVPSTPNSSESASRVPDGGSTWQIGIPTRTDNSTACPPDPTPNPDPTSTPSPTPTPAPASTNTPTPAPTKSPSATPKPTPKATPTPTSQPTAILGEATDITPSPSPSPSPEAESGTLSKTKAAALITGAGAILIALSFGFYLWYSKLLGREKAEDVIEIEETL